MAEANFPEPEEVTEKMKELSKDEKLKLIGKEGQSLYDYCVAQGFSVEELRSCLKPFHAARPKAQAVLEDSKRTTYGIALLVAFVAMFAYYPAAYNMLCVHGKLATMKLLPYWDWTTIYAEDCMIYNPYMKAYNMTKDDCQACVEVHEKGAVERLSDAKQESISEEFLWVDFPVLIEDGQKDWPTNHTLTLDEILNLYNTDKLQSVNECFFNTTIPDIETIGEFLQMYEENMLPSEPWLVTWENCDLQAAKAFRHFYKRPYFFAPMAEASRTNQILISKGMPSNVTYVSGSLEYELQHSAACEEFGCGSVAGKVDPGEILVVPQRIWQAEVGPGSKDLTVAIITAVTWDEM